MTDLFEYEEENELTDCPNCQRSYDDADRDFAICHWCGYDATKKKFTRSIKRPTIGEMIDDGGFSAGWDY